MTDSPPLTAENPQGKPWLVRLTCCGRADGVYAALTWDEADRFRLSYTAPGHYDNVPGLGGGHRRSAVIEDGYAPATRAKASGDGHPLTVKDGIGTCQTCGAVGEVATPAPAGRLRGGQQMLAAAELAPDAGRDPAPAGLRAAAQAVLELWFGDGINDIDKDGIDGAMDALEVALAATPAPAGLDVEELRSFAELMEAEWFNGNINEHAYARLNADLEGIFMDARFQPAPLTGEDKV